MLRIWVSGLIALGLAACGAPSTETAERVLNRGNEMEPGSLDPHVAYITGERQIISDLFVGLYEPDATGRAILGLASSAQTSPDGLTWTFILREASWSDGAPITAGDVVGGLRRALDPATRNTYPTTLFVIEGAQAISESGAPVDSLGAEAVDDQTVVIRLEHPAPYLPTILAVWGQPVPMHVIAEHGDAWIQPQHIVVSGAYDLVRWRGNDFIELERNPNFYEADQVCLDRVYYYPTIDTAAAERRVRNNELDLNTEFTGANLAFLRERHEELVDISPGLVMRTVMFNTASNIGGDVRVRTALGMAIDRRFIADEILAGADAAAYRYVPDGISGRADGPRLTYIDEDMDARRAQARALLEAAGYGPDNPLEATFYFQPAAGWPRVAPVIQRDWSLIADWVNVEIAVRDSQLHYAAMRAGDFDVASSGWVGDFDDPYAYLLQFGSGAGDINMSRYEDAAFEAIIAEALMNPDLEERSAQLAQAEQIFLDAGPETPIFVESTKNLVSPRVNGWQASPWQINPSRWLCVE